MRRALELAQQARHRTSPNPMVGAVVVVDGEIVGEGYHRRAGEDHAEIVALRQAGTRARGATMYVTLEPCSHTGRTPPCTEALISAGISRAVIATEDPHPPVSGNGLRMLRLAAITTDVGDGAEEAQAINLRWLMSLREHRPFVGLKFAMSLDGKIATATRKARWITGEAARAESHRLRSVYDGVLVGAATVIDDDPQLTARGFDGSSAERQPARVVLDGRLRVPATARVFARDGGGTTMVATSRGGYARRGAELEAAGAAVEVCGEDDRLEVREVLQVLNRRGLHSLLVEGGGEVAWAFVDAGVVDHVYGFVAPSLMGGASAPTAVDGGGFTTPDAAFRLNFVALEQVGEDVLLEAVPA
jgi:diaminohydroxyphosphoribosylaminopyrimidine deaminase/5-amino-6-(5-phosphoribosylamino)uracil reductase